MILVVVVVLALATWRVTHFFLEDSLIDISRAKWLAWLSQRATKMRYRKALELSTCPWCLSIWIAAAATAAWRFGTSDGAGTAVVWTIVTWLAVAGGAMAAWQSWESS